MSNPVWGKEELIILRRMRPVATVREIQEVLDRCGYQRTYKAIERKGEKLGIARTGLLGTPNIEGLSSDISQNILDVINEREDKAPSISGIRDFNPRPSKTEKTSALDHIKELLAIEDTYDLTRRDPDIPVVSNDLSLVVLLSDWHIGKHIEDEAGRFSYNLLVAKKRAEELFRQIRARVRLHDPDEIVICLLGDIVDGSGIFETQAEEIEFSPLIQTSHAIEILWTEIVTLSNLFPDKEIRIVSTIGNHGKIKGSLISNWDNVVYHHLQVSLKLRTLSGKKPITISNNFTGDYNKTVIKGWNFYLRHKAPAQVETAAGKARFGGWYAVHHFDCVVYGHLHHIGYNTWNGKHIIRNGSLVGGDPFAESLGCYDNPTQAIILTSEDKLIEDFIPIEV